MDTEMEEEIKVFEAISKINLTVFVLKFFIPICLCIFVILPNCLSWLSEEKIFAIIAMSLVFACFVFGIVNIYLSSIIEKNVDILRRIANNSKQARETQS